MPNRLGRGGTPASSGAQVGPTRLMRIERDQRWINEVFAFIERNPNFYVLNDLRPTFPYPGTSRFNETEILTEVASETADGSELTVSLTAPTRGTLRHWIFLRAFCNAGAARDARLGVLFKTLVFSIVSDASFASDDDMSANNLLCCSDMVPQLNVQIAESTFVYTIQGAFVEYPEGETQSFPTVTATVSG